MLARAPAPLLMIAAAFSFQSGAAVATYLFDTAGPLGTVLLRVGFAALVLLALNGRGLLRTRGRHIRWIVALGVSLAVMNASFYASLDRIPLGVSVTIEFLGPLAVAVGGSRRPLDFVWVLLAGGGVALLGSPTVDVDPVGILLALLAATFWAFFILSAKQVTTHWPLRLGLTGSMVIAAVLFAPVGLVADGGRLGHLWLLPAGLGVAVLSSVVPYGLELAALRRLRTSVYSIILSLEPAVAAIVGAIFLAQRPSVPEGIAIVLVVAASIGASRGARRIVPVEA